MCGRKPTFESLPIPTELAEGDIGDLGVVEDVKLAKLVLTIFEKVREG